MRLLLYAWKGGQSILMIASSTKSLRIFFKYITLSVVYLIVFGALWFIIVYASIFRLSEKEVDSLLNRHSYTQCEEILSCIKDGDILIRRKITEETEFFDKTINPYFTHTALYLGDGLVFEAVGSRPNPADDIVSYPLNQSDWIGNATVTPEKVFILRLSLEEQVLKSIRNSLSDIAQDPEYRFAFYITGEKRTQCSEVILKELEKVGTFNGVLDVERIFPKHITPDYLFYFLSKNNAQIIEVI